MDTTTPCETSSEESFNWNNLSDEFKAFEKISNKNIQALAELCEDISKLQLADAEMDIYTRVEERTKFLSSYVTAKNLTQEQEEVSVLKASEKKILKNIDNITNKMSFIEQEIKNCTEERKKLRKEYKTSESLLHRVIKSYETRFNMKLELDELSDDKLKSSISFLNLPPEKSIKIHVSLGNEMKIDGIEAVDIGQKEMQHFERCLQDETKVTPTFCVIRDLLNSKS